MLQFGNKPPFRLAIHTYTRHTIYMNEITQAFANAVQVEVIKTFTPEEIDQLMEMLKDF